MTHPAFLDGSFAHLKLGALPSKRDPRQLQLARYLPTLPPIPTNAGPDDRRPELADVRQRRSRRLHLRAVGHMIQAWTAALAR